MPGPSSVELENALSVVLGGTLDIAGAVRVHTTDKGVQVEVSSPHMEYKSIRSYECLGSPLASIAAALAAEAFDKPIAIENETHSRNKSVIDLVILP